MGISKVTYSLDLSEALEMVPKDEWDSVLNDVGQYLVEAILSDVGEGRSPVTGHSFKGLSEDYKEVKKQVSSAVIPNMELTGEMLDSLTYQVRGTRVEVGIWGDQAPKADGHCNHSGKSALPKRTFVPNAKDGEQFRPDIRDEISGIIEEHQSADVEGTGIPLSFLIRGK